MRKGHARRSPVVDPFLVVLQLNHAVVSKEFELVGHLVRLEILVVLNVFRDKHAGEFIVTARLHQFQRPVADHVAQSDIDSNRTVGIRSQGIDDLLLW